MFRSKKEPFMCDSAEKTFEVPAYDAEAIETKWQKTWAEEEL